MKSYDTFTYKCPSCGKKTISRTKVLGECKLECFKVGSEVHVEDCVLQLRDSCKHCGKENSILIIDGQIIKVVDVIPPTKVEV